MIPAPPLPPEAALDEQERDDLRRQTRGSGVEAVADGADLALGVVDLATSGAADMAAQAAGAVADAAGAVLGATAEVAKVSLEVVGGILGGLADP
ncbi:hypothetical protein GXW74_04435 [Roseomonas eburnea]|uniref:Uncharacterized protein n=1 Tax=Neoroseomonas eburnea TaxID=1346889 RepID=A0A9X9X7N5_9PROT|nr:hypothetical protein [Neoroseomonas eburnea]MBR0679721.1 hypothetical protein [Neoroseomonas eburnea]